MTIEYLALGLALIYLPLLLVDLKNLQRQQERTETSVLSDTVCLLTPFASLGYHEQFWHSILYFLLPLNIYYLVASMAIRRWRKIAFDPSVNLIAVGGGYLMSAIMYYLAFNQGPLVADAVQTAAPSQPFWQWRLWLPFAAILAAAAATCVANRESWIFPLGITLLIIPFFASHALWAMACAALAYFYVCYSQAKKHDNHGLFVAFIFYLFGQFTALIIYAVLF
jgi:hypothetical protein